MRVTFDKYIREQAKAKGHPPIAFVVDKFFESQTHILNDDQADVLAAFMIHLLHNRRTPQEAFDMSFNQHARLFEQ